MKQTRLLRTLLVALCLLTGTTSLWGYDAGDEITNLNLIFNGSTSGNLTYVLGTGEVASGNGTGQYWSPGVAVDSDNKRLKLANGNLTFGLANTSEFGNKDVVTISYDVALGYSTKDENRDFVFQIKNSEGTAIITETYNSRNSVRHSSSLGFSRDDMYNPGNANTDWANKVHFEITFNYATKKISATSSCATATNKTKTISAFDMSEAQQVYIGSIYISTGNMNAMDHTNLLANLKVITTKGDYSSTKTITYAYQDNNGTDITDLAISKGATASATPENGSTYTPEYPASFIDDDYAYDYTYTSGGDAFTVTSDRTITLVYTKSAHPTTDVTVQYKSGTSIFKEDKVAEGFPVGKTKGYVVRKYVLDTTSKTLYESASGTWRDVVAAEYVAENVTATSIKNVVFFSEGEELAGCTQSSSGNYSVASRQSMGRKLPMASVTTLGKGKYQLYAMFHVGNGSDSNKDHKTIKFYAGSDEIGSKTIKERSNSQSYTLDFTLSESKEIFIDCDDAGSSSGLDYIYIVQTGVSATTTSAGKGWATLYTDVPLDFENATPAGLKAYTATLSNNTVTLTDVQNVPAGTGVVLKGAANTYSIPVIANSETPQGDMTGSATSDTPLDEGEAYILGINGTTGKAQFFINSEGTIAAGKAYLPTGGKAGAKALSVVFANDLTGITNANAAEEAAQPAKRIVNGQLVIEKNGKRYNAAGAEF